MRADWRAMLTEEEREDYDSCLEFPGDAPAMADLFEKVVVRLRDQALEEAAAICDTAACCTPATCGLATVAAQVRRKKSTP